MWSVRRGPGLGTQSTGREEAEVQEPRCDAVPVAPGGKRTGFVDCGEGVRSWGLVQLGRLRGWGSKDSQV